MKKNCFIYTVFLGTIIIASTIYLIENHFSDLILNKGKNFVVREIESEWNEDLNYVSDSVQKDSLKSLIKEFILHYEEFGDLLRTSSAQNNFTGSIVKSFEDSLITEEEIADITELLSKVKNEKHKSN